MKSVEDKKYLCALRNWPVWGDNDGFARFSGACDCIPEQASGHGVHASGWLIQEDDRWPANQSHTCTQLPLVAPTVWQKLIRKVAQYLYIILYQSFLPFLRLSTISKIFPDWNVIYVFQISLWYSQIFCVAFPEWNCLYLAVLVPNLHPLFLFVICSLLSMVSISIPVTADQFVSMWLQEQRAEHILHTCKHVFLWDSSEPCIHAESLTTSHVIQHSVKLRAVANSLLYLQVTHGRVTIKNIIIKQHLLTYGTYVLLFKRHSQSKMFTLLIINYLLE